jgi:hypothetical protein
MVILATDPPSEDAANKFEDLSGVEIKPGDNPYNALINACDGSPVSSLFLSLLGKDRLLDYRGKETAPAAPTASAELDGSWRSKAEPREAGATGPEWGAGPGAGPGARAPGRAGELKK